MAKKLTYEELEGRVKELEKKVLERNRAEEVLRESEEKFRNFLDNLGDAAYETDSSGNVTYANKMSEIITGVPLKDIIGKPFLPLFTKESQKMAIDVYQRTLNGESLEYELTFSNGRICHFKNKTLRDENGKITGVFGIARDITERRSAEEELRFLSSVTQQIMDSVIVTNFDFEITYINKATEKLYGYSREELIGKIPDILNAEPMAEQIQEDIYKTVTTGKVWGGEHLNRKKEGGTFICDFKISPLADDQGQIYGYIGIQRDVSKRKQAEEALRDSEEKYRLLVENTQDGIVAVNPKGDFLYANEAAAKNLGYTTEEFLKLNITNIEAKESRKEFEKHYNDMLQGKKFTFETLHRKKDGSLTNVDISLNQFCHKGEIICYSIWRDISKHKRAEKKLRKAHDELEQRVEKRTAELLKANESLMQEIQERKKAEQELEIQTRDLEEVNTALRVLLRKREEDKTKIEENVLSNIKELVEPYLEKLKKSVLDANQMSCVNVLESNLNDIISPFSNRLSSKFLKLSPSEIRIANLVKQGKNTKEIAGLMNLSSTTVATHRRNIRKKLGISVKKANLRTHLLSVQ